MKYICTKPACGRVYDSPVKLSQPPSCTGKKSHHSPTEMKAKS